MEAQTDQQPREIRDVALLDLTGANAAAALEGVTRISHVAAILVPESLVSRLSSIPMEGVAATIPVPAGRRPRVFSGQITLSGEALANAEGQDADMLVIAGKLIITSPVQKVGYADLIVMGQIFAPHGSETALGAGVSRMSGQVIYYPYVDGAMIRLNTSATISGDALANTTGDASDVLLNMGQLVVTSAIQRLGYQRVVVLGNLLVPGATDPGLLERFTSIGGQVATYTAKPRVFDGKDHFSAGFFELFDEPMTLVLDGKFSFDEDIAPELLRQKVSAIVLDGKIRAPRRLVPMLQMLCVVRDGSIQAGDETE